MQIYFCIDSYFRRGKRRNGVEILRVSKFAHYARNTYVKNPQITIEWLETNQSESFRNTSHSRNVSTQTFEHFREPLFLTPVRISSAEAESCGCRWRARAPPLISGTFESVLRVRRFGEKRRGIRKVESLLLLSFLSWHLATRPVPRIIGLEDKYTQCRSTNLWKSYEMERGWSSRDDEKMRVMRAFLRIEI